jgi:hypothetical protein
MPPAPDVDEDAARLRRDRREPRYSATPSALRSGVDPPGDAVLQHEGGTFWGSSGMRVNVNEPRNDQLATRIDDVGRLARDAGFDRGYASVRDGHVASGVEAHGGIDYAATPNDQIELRRLSRDRSWNPGERRCTRGGCRKKLAPVQHGCLRTADSEPCTLNRTQNPEPGTPNQNPEPCTFNPNPARNLYRIPCKSASAAINPRRSSLRQRRRARNATALALDHR